MDDSTGNAPLAGDRGATQEPATGQNAKRLRETRLCIHATVAEPFGAVQSISHSKPQNFYKGDYHNG